jgi:nucleotide-binding universal stress UspA family protein
MDGRRHGILIGYDGSEDADSAVEWAAEAARLREEPVVVVIAEDTGADAIGLRWWPQSYWRELGERAQGLLHEAGVRDVRVERHAGALVPALVPLADEATMLVLGSRGHGRAGQAFVGSTSQRAAGHAPCPVVVVREQANADSDRLVVGVDGSPGSEAALEFACRQAELTKQRVQVLHGTGAEGDATSAMADVVARARVGHPDVPLETEKIDEGAGQALVDASSDATLVVVGSRGLRAYEGMQLGSVSHDVLRRAHCPVAVVR